MTTTSTTIDEPTVEVYVPKLVAWDWEGRELARSVARSTGPNPYAKVPSNGGLVRFTEAELREVWADADYYTDPNGPAMSLDKNERAAYRRMRDKASAGLAQFAEAPR